MNNISVSLIISMPTLQLSKVAIIISHLNSLVPDKPTLLSLPFDFISIITLLIDQTSGYQIQLVQVPPILDTHGMNNVYKSYLVYIINNSIKMVI